MNFTYSSVGFCSAFSAKDVGCFFGGWGAFSFFGSLSFTYAFKYFVYYFAESNLLDIRTGLAYKMQAVRNVSLDLRQWCSICRRNLPCAVHFMVTAVVSNGCDCFPWLL